MDADDGQLIRFQHHQGWACYCNEKRQLVVIFKKGGSDEPPFCTHHVKIF